MKTNLKKITSFALLSLAAILVTQMTMPVSAGTNDATQTAYTDKITTIAIKDQAGASEITNIYFPTAAVSTEVTDAWNNIDGDSSKQTFGGTSLPAAWLVSGTTYNLWVTVTDTGSWDTTIVDENILCSDSLTLDKATFDTGKFALSTWGTATDVGDQTVTTTKKYLYLTVNLDSVAGKTGTSTFTILGES